MSTAPSSDDERRPVAARPGPSGGRGEQAARAAPPGRVEWCVSAAAAARWMALLHCDELLVVDGGSVVGRVTRDDIEVLLRCGDWPDSVLVRDLMRRLPR
jgi:hypothetical protein